MLRVVALGTAAAALVAPSARVGRAPSARVGRAPALRVEPCGECDDWNPFGEGCKPCEDGRSVFVNDRIVSSKVLRDVEVVAASGARMRLDDVMTGRGAVVVFLRHLG